MSLVKVNGWSKREGVSRRPAEPDGSWNRPALDAESSGTRKASSGTRSGNYRADAGSSGVAGIHAATQFLAKGGRPRIPSFGALLAVGGNTDPCGLGSAAFG